jgi:orotidine-5'-phosphate decarboxylase
MLDVHALGGLEMMRAAAKARDESKLPKPLRPKVIGITILTSMDSGALKETGIAGPPSKRVVSLARLAQKAGLDGVVASPQEVRAIRRACGKDFLIVVPGIRPAVGGLGRASKGLKDDQSRIATPAEAIRAGADYLVVCRPIQQRPIRKPLPEPYWMKSAQPLLRNGFLLSQICTDAESVAGMFSE